MGKKKNGSWKVNWMKLSKLRSLWFLVFFKKDWRFVWRQYIVKIVNAIRWVSSLRMSEECLSGGESDCENGWKEEREEERSVWMEKVNTKAVKILEVLSVLVIVMARGCEEGWMGWRTGWRGFWQLMMQGRAEEKGGPYLTGPGLFCVMVNCAKWTWGPWFSMYLGLEPGYGVWLVYHSTPV